MSSWITKFECFAVMLVGLCLAAGAQNSVRRSHYGLPVDYSHRFLISHTQLSDVDFERTALTEPRVLYNWVIRHPQSLTIDNPDILVYRPPLRPILRKPPSMAVDWHFPLGSGTIPIGAGPSKFGFNLNQAPSCANDYVAYGLNTAGSAAQPNLIGFNNLYVNATANGYCTGRTNPTVAFAYNVTSTGGDGKILSTMPLSLDGTKIAFIESVTTSTAGQPCAAPCSIFHVLTIGSGAGNGSFSTVTNTYTAAIPGIGNAASLTSLVFSNHVSTRSFPFVDYTNDVAYFGDDNGNLYKTTCVFKSSCTPALAAGYSAGSGIGVVTTGSNRILTGPIIDTTANKLFVGASDGKVYIVNLANCSGTPVSCSGTVSLTVGNAATNSAPCFTGYGGVVDPPVIDVTFQIWYATSACTGATGDAAMVEGDYSGTAQGPGIAMKSGPYNIHSGLPDDNYYTTALNATAVGGNVYFLGPASSKQVVLYGAVMAPKNGAGTALTTSNPPIVSATVTAVSVPGNGVSEPSAVTIVQNGTADWLFFGQVSVPKNSCNNSGGAEGCALSYNVFNSSGVSTVPTANSALAPEAAGTSGIIVDNVANSTTYPGASSIYFANQGTSSTSPATALCTTGVSTPSYCAVKLTQAALQ
jgi:hypothetical protein